MKTPQHTPHKAALALRSAKREAGFTLIEMLAVLAVVGVLLAVAVIGFNAFGRGTRLRTAGRLIAQQLDLARQRALTFRCMYGVEFEPHDSPDRDRLRVYYGDPSTGPTIGKWIELPPGIEFGPGTVPTTIEFKPTGSAVVSSGAEKFKIHDEETDKERTIEVVPITGHTKVYTE